MCCGLIPRVRRFLKRLFFPDEEEQLSGEVNSKREWSSLPAGSSAEEKSFRNGENQLPYNLSEPLGKLSENGKTGTNPSTQRAKRQMHS
ncbi:unnamed protein product [Porites evermanni]|uniref:Uncharacterized protein n=1 Tax=Porites evermanni TaxID=104178 RepID=A0ABN8LIT7_9CNID|nr:unnamed protein product [Porites evermanni]